MDQEDFTARNLAKWLLTAAVSMKTADLTANTVASNTSFDKDAFAVRLGAGAVGWAVGTKIKPVTDAVVDKSADFVVAQWDKRRSKKDTKNEEK